MSQASIIPQKCRTAGGDYNFDVGVISEVAVRYLIVFCTTYLHMFGDNTDGQLGLLATAGDIDGNDWRPEAYTHAHPYTYTHSHINTHPHPHLHVDTHTHTHTLSLSFSHTPNSLPLFCN